MSRANKYYRMSSLLKTLLVNEPKESNYNLITTDAQGREKIVVMNTSRAAIRRMFVEADLHYKEIKRQGFDGMDAVMKEQKEARNLEAKTRRERQLTKNTPKHKFDRESV